MSDSSRPHGLQTARLPCPPVSPGACSNSCPLSQWCHPTISSSLIPFFSCLEKDPESGSFSMTWLSLSGGQSIGASASAWVLPKNIQGWFPLGLTGLISLQFLTAYSSLQLCFLQLLSRNSQVFSSTTVLKPIISLKNLLFLRNSKPFLQVLIPHHEHWTRLLFSHCAKHILLG